MILPTILFLAWIDKRTHLHDRLADLVLPEGSVWPTDEQIDTAVANCTAPARSAYAESNGGDAKSFELDRSEAGEEAGSDVLEPCVLGCFALDEDCVEECNMKAEHEMETLGVRSPLRT